MKNIVLLASFIISAEAFSMAPLIIKSNHSGYTSPEHSRYEICEVYPSHIEIRTRQGLGNETVQNIRIEVDYVQLTNLIKAAKKAKMNNEDNYLCDGPSSSIYANLENPAATEEVSLYSTGGCGSPKMKRNGKAAEALRKLVLTYCPEIY